FARRRPTDRAAALKRWVQAGALGDAGAGAVVWGSSWVCIVLDWEWVRKKGGKDNVIFDKGRGARWRRGLGERWDAGCEALLEKLRLRERRLALLPDSE